MEEEVMEHKEYAVIPARGGSQRISRKNIREFYGRPILCYSIDLARAVGLVPVVSTEDPEIASIASSAGAVIRQRPFELARDDVGTHDVWIDALNAVGARRGRSACIYPCAPLLDAEVFKIGRMGRTYAMTVGANPLRDAGAGYWGDVRDLRAGHPLITDATRLIVLHDDDVVDINTEEDWFIAENRYALKHGIEPVHTGSFLAPRPGGITWFDHEPTAAA
jgi:N-acylneuraminate cytidylyltransferase